MADRAVHYGAICVFTMGGIPHLAFPSAIQGALRGNHIGVFSQTCGVGVEAHSLRPWPFRKREDVHVGCPGQEVRAAAHQHGLQ